MNTISSSSHTIMSRSSKTRADYRFAERLVSLRCHYNPLSIHFPMWSLVSKQSPGVIKRREVSWTLTKKLDAFAGPG